MAAPDFGQLFIDSKGQPVSYRGHALIISDRIAAKFGQRFAVTIESTRSKHVQGVGISEDVHVFGKTVRRGVIWEYFSVPSEERNACRSVLPFSFEVECRNTRGYLSFYNMAELSGGRQAWWHGSSCMWCEAMANGRRYHCNDFEPDDDFDDIIFTVTW